jgi:hypothetical protein
MHESVPLRESSALLRFKLLKHLPCVPQRLVGSEKLLRQRIVL